MNLDDWSDDKILERLLSLKSDSSRWKYIRVLRKRPSEALFNKCVELTKSSNLIVKEIGINILSQLGSTPRPFLNETLVSFFELLKTEKNPKIISLILFGIGHNNEKLIKKHR